MPRTLQPTTTSPFPPPLTSKINGLLNSCSSLTALKLTHAQILTHGLHRRLPCTTKLISLAAALSPTIDYARQMFDAIPHRDSFAWNTLIRGYSNLGPCREIPFLYKAMHGSGFSPDRFTFPFVVRSCAVLSLILEGKEAHCNAVKNGLGSSGFVQSALIAMYSQAGEVSDSESVFCETGVRNVVSWTAMIAGYAQNRYSGSAVGVFRRMVGSSAVRPNEVTLASILPACDGPGFLDSGRSIHGFVIRTGMDSFVVLANALITMYGRCGEVEVSRSLFDGMPCRSLVSWNAMIAAYEQRGLGGEAIGLFTAMLAERVKFDAVTLVSAVSACTSLGSLEKGRWVHELARRSGLEIDARIGNALIDMYAKCGSVGSARDLFTRLPSKSVVAWSSMIGAYTAHGNAKEAFKLFSWMKSEGTRPNGLTFTSVLAACSHSGLVEEGMQHFKSMRDYGIVPAMEHCACIVDLLARAGRLEDALEFVKRMPVRPDSGVWGALLGGCRIYGNLELAETVMEDCLRTDPHNATLYLLMANIYADAGRWEDAARLRKSMNDKELKKIPGCSSVQA